MAAQVASYNKKYLRMKPEVKTIFEDLEDFHDWVRLQYPQIPFNEADLYKNSSPVWQKYLKSQGKNATKK
jgi:hypothetical protein